jgi:hypothetical protein
VFLEKTYSYKVFLIQFLILLAVIPNAQAQETVIKGKVTDVSSGDPIPFVNIVFKGTSIGTTTDFEGNYRIKTSSPKDSLVASYIGYRPRTKAVVKGVEQTIHFQLEEEVTRLKEIVFLAGENPAFDILRKVVKNKNKNDKRNLSAYEYDTYSKIEIDIDNITDRFRKKKIVKKITQVLDSIDRLAGEDGKPVLPVFISESVSKFYYRRDPELKHENIQHTKISGVGVEDGSLVAQVIGSSFQEYNFYKNWLNIVSKDFVSPIADGWRLYYEYDLMDSLYLGDHYCYRLDFFPKSPQDLAFTGTMWITKDDYALKQIEVTVPKEANLNFIERIKIQQELEPTGNGAWIPVKNRVLIDIGEIQDQWAGLLAKFYTSNKNIVVNKPRELKFYENPIVLEEDYKQNQEENYWNTLRHEPLTEAEQNVYAMIDTLQNIPIVKTYIDVLKIIINGYKSFGKIDIGPYINLISINDVEGTRFQSGFKTNAHFSNKWVLGGQLGYGIQDEKFKYAAFVRHIVDRKKWTTLDLRVRSDLGRVGIDDESLADNYLFLAASRFGVFRRGYYFDEARFNFQREVFKGYNQRIVFRYNTFRPIFNFSYYRNPADVVRDSAQSYQTAEVILESRFARDELFIQNDNERLSLGAQKWPIVTVRYTRGIAGINGSDFSYNKFRLNFYKRIRLGPIGTGYASITGEYVFETLPYPLLSFHLGNETPFYTDITYSLMNYGEFISDRFISLQYRQRFEGFLLNRIPLMRKLKWRLTGLTNVIYGGLRDDNRIYPSETPTADPVLLPGFLSPRTPYVELGYGVENIFKFFRIDFVHRLTYLDNDRARKFGVLFTVQFQL